ncbi:hypothetical protein NL676_039869 [Syzygium grande]|nr:hypothetical protein NL676_039869 [Syzygium grande]
MADSVFDGLSRPNLFPYTAVVSGLAKADRLLEAAVEAFVRLMSSGIQPNEVELGLPVNSSVAETGHLESVSFRMHSWMMWRPCLRIWTRGIRAYAEFGLIDTAVELFHIMPEKTRVSRNALLAELCENGKAFEVLDLFISIVGKGLELTDYTLTTVAKACGLLGAGKLCQQLQGFIIEFGLLANACVEAALLDMCTHCGRTVDAGKMFKRWKDVQTVAF